MGLKKPKVRAQAIKATRTAAIINKKSSIYKIAIRPILTIEIMESIEIKVIGIAGKTPQDMEGIAISSFGEKQVHAQLRKNQNIVGSPV